jgi:GNAT superfamily N-acetyltransferase
MPEVSSAIVNSPRPPSAARCRSKTGSYRIRGVDGHDEEIAETLAELHRLTFFDGAPVPPFDGGHWWLAYCEAMPIAFAGVVPSTHVRNAGYICRVGVLAEHCGRRLQLRLMRAIEARARRSGWSYLVSDTTRNIPSANNFIRAGYRLYQPRHPWAFADTLYWRKIIRYHPPLHGTPSKKTVPHDLDGSSLLD